MALEFEVKEVTVLPDDEDFLDADMSLLVGDFLAGVGRMSLMLALGGQ